MLAPQLLVPIGIFVLLENDCTEVLRYENDVLRGVEPGDSSELLAFWRDPDRGAIIRTFTYRGTAGDRKRHALLGRIL